MTVSNSGYHAPAGVVIDVDYDAQGMACDRVMIMSEVFDETSPQGFSRG